MNSCPHHSLLSKKQTNIQFTKQHTHTYIINQCLFILIPSLTWLHWILYAEHGRPVPIPHRSQHVLLGQVGPSTLHPNAGFHVVEIAAVQLKELDQEDAQVDVGTSCVDPRV